MKSNICFCPSHETYIEKKLITYIFFVVCYCKETPKAIYLSMCFPNNFINALFSRKNRVKIGYLKNKSQVSNWNEKYFK